MFCGPTLFRKWFMILSLYILRMYKISRRTNQVTETKYVTSKLIVGGKMEENQFEKKKER